MAACQNCGEELPQGVSFCPNCGKSTSEQAQAGQQVASASGGAPPPPPGMTPPSSPTPPPQSPQASVGTPPPPGGMPPAGTMTAMPPRPMKPAKKGMSRGLKIGLIVALCLVVLIVAGIIVGVFAFVKVLSAPADVANNYVKAINDGNLDEAFSYLSAETKGTTGLAEFKEKLGPFEGNITKYNTSKIEVKSGSPSTADIAMNLAFSDGTKDVWDIGLVKENGVWKIQVVRPRSAS